MHDTDSSAVAAADGSLLQPAGPVSASERLQSLDMLRGVAILGILVMNIYTFAMPFVAYTNPLIYGGTDPLNLGTWLFTHIFFDLKFMSIFAMMFGAGIVLMTDRAEARGARQGRIHYRRQFWLVVLGSLHGYFIWFGDILFLYAVIGMLAYLFRKLRPSTLLIVAFCLLPVTLLLGYGNAVMMDAMQAEVAEVSALEAAGTELSEEQQQVLDNWEASRSFLAPTDEDIQKDIEIHKGTYAEILSYRMPLYASMQVFLVLFYGLWRILAIMLIGMALMKYGVLSGERPAAFYRRLMYVSYALGLPLTVYSALDLQAHQFDQVYAFRLGGIWNYYGSLLVALGHVGLVMLVYKSGVLQALMARFAAVGRMAISNYLSHSILLTTVFYGYGLGLYGDIERFWQMGFVVAVIVLQLLWSPWWLARYRFGPVEWLWRSLTYGRRQPMRH